MKYFFNIRKCADDKKYYVIKPTSTSYIGIISLLSAALSIIV